MNSHYLGLGPTANQKARELFAGAKNLEEKCVADLTFEGTLLKFAPLPATEEGPRIAIYGRHLYAEAGPDRTRDDTLFVFRLYARSPSTPAEPSVLEARFDWLAWRDSAERDAIRHLFIARPVPRAVPAPTTATTAARTGLAATLGVKRPTITLPTDLKSVLSNAPSDVRSAFYPVSHASSPTLSELRALWQRLVENARKAPAAPTRDDRILDGTITPSNISEKGLEELREFFEHTFFSQVLEPDIASPHRLLPRLGEFCRSGLASQQTLAELWLGSTDHALPDDLRTELIALSPSLAQLDSPELQRLWWDVVCSAVYRLRGAHPDSSPNASKVEPLLSMLSEVDDAEVNEVQALARWAQREREFIAAEDRSSEPAPRCERVSQPPLPSVPPEPDLSTDEEHALEEWVLALRGLERTSLNLLREDVLNLARHAENLARSLTSIDGMNAAPEFGRFLREILERQQDAFSEQKAVELSAVRAATREAMAAAVRHVDRRAVVEVVQRRPVKPTDLQEAAGLFEKRELWRHLPRWWWQQAYDEVSGTPWPDPPTDSAYLDLFCSAPARNATRTACERLAEIDAAALPALADLPVPPKGTSGAAHLAAELHRFTQAYQAARHKYRSSLAMLLDNSMLQREEFMDLAERLDKIERRVSASALSPLLAEIATCDRSEKARAFVRAVDQALQQLADANAGSDASDDERNEVTRELGGTLVLKKARALLTAPSIPAAAEPLGFTLRTLDVGTTDDPKDRPPLVFLPRGGDANAPVGTTSVPLVLRSRRPRALTVTVGIVNDTSPLRTRWPSDGSWGSVDAEPGNHTIDSEDWHKDGQEFEVALPVLVPIRRPQQPTQALPLTFEVRDVATPAVLVERVEWKRWSSPEEGDGGPLVAGWSKSENAQYAEDVPVGPQVHVSEILERVRSDNALAITAPRRFGKSSLIAFLEKRIQAMPDTVSVRVDCSTHTSGDSGQLDHSQLWRTVSEELKRHSEGVGLELGEGVYVDRGKPIPPKPEAFDHARRQLARLGKSRLVIFFDEAQRMFDAGPTYGAKLRALIATHIGRRTPDLAAIVLCFVGLPSMTPERLGADLYPLLNPLQHAELGHDEVARVIRRVTRGRMYTSRMARERIARSSWNLYALRTILERLGRRVTNSHRVWASVEDVIEVESALIRELRDGQDPESIGTYIGDALNASCSPDDFQPIPAYPVAAAYALALDENHGGKGAIEACERTLREWADKFFRSEIFRPSYEQAQVAAHLRELEEQRVLEGINDVLGGYRFRSPFLGAFLVGQRRRYDYSDRVLADSMLRTSFRRIRLPAERHPVDRGAQASVVRFRRGQDELAARLRELRTPEQQEDFIEGRSLLERLASIHNGNREGAESLYKLVEIGFLEDRSPILVGAEVYFYIPGSSLETKLGELGAPIVAALGLQLVKALRLIHEADILHRDIRPSNVILQEHATNPVLPVFIDFGLACSRSKPGMTPIDDEFTAPEVKGPNPRWTPSADVFALACTLRKLLPRIPSGLDKHLHEALSKIATPKTQQRESTASLAEILGKVASDAQVAQRRELFLERAQKLLESDPREGDLQWLMRNRWAPELEGFAMGLYTTDIERARCIASLVNKAAERIEGMTLHELTSTRFPANTPRAILAVMRARNEGAHGGASRSAYGLAEVREGARLISKMVASPALHRLTEFLVTHRH